ncbi:zinc finger CCCH domain-containing protein 13-like isoform X2 [Neocloeon triangulifer]|uniref:zinc finger CCCH domain-containing protein 13-like isoform X2 n=1 Tax=Neocloeon triangulifer TaxID=2078957 RepID=UPI00286FAAA1|nr:zinc finger CCCH domain-containing protein 13-like isoform X2 [Neocloeon triangulifer]
MSSVRKRLQEDTEMFLMPSGKHNEQPVVIADPKKKAGYCRQETRKTLQAKKMMEQASHVTAVQQQREYPEERVLALQEKYRRQNEKKKKQELFGTRPYDASKNLKNVSKVMNAYSNQVKDINMVAQARRKSTEDQAPFVFEGDEDTHQVPARSRSGSRGKSSSKNAKKRRHSSHSADGKAKRRKTKDDSEKKKKQEEKQKENEKDKKIRQLEKEKEELKKKLRDKEKQELKDRERKKQKELEEKEKEKEAKKIRERRTIPPSPEKVRNQQALEMLRKRRMQRQENRAEHENGESDNEESEKEESFEEDGEETEFEEGEETDFEEEENASEAEEESEVAEPAPAPEFGESDHEEEHHQYLSQEKPPEPPTRSSLPSQDATSAETHREPLSIRSRAPATSDNLELKPFDLPESVKSSRIAEIIDDTQYENVVEKLQSLLSSQPPQKLDAASNDSDDEEPAPKPKDLKPTTIEDIKKLKFYTISELPDPLAVINGNRELEKSLCEAVYKSKLLIECFREDIVEVDNALPQAEDFTSYRVKVITKYLDECMDLKKKSELSRPATVTL